jgi:hypothetical protein
MSTQTTTTKKPRAKRGSKNWYFTAETDASIRLYNASEDPSERSLIYSKEIRPAFEKLVENIIHTFKFYYTDGQSLKDVQHEVVGFLVEKLSKFSSDKGKAFSYFSIIAKNYLILSNNKNYKKLTENSKIDSLSETALAFTIADDGPEEDLLPDFLDYFVNYYDENLEKCFPKKTDQAVVSAIVELFRKRENLEIFNKKALYIYIREMTECETPTLTRVINKLKDEYIKLTKSYIQAGVVVEYKPS